jgi:hypothetical protein
MQLPGKNQPDGAQFGVGGKTPPPFLLRDDPPFVFLLVDHKGTRLANMEIALLEAENRGSIISSPRALTKDRHEVVIQQGMQTPNEVPAERFCRSIPPLRLLAKPRITPDNKIFVAFALVRDASMCKTDGEALDAGKTQFNILANDGGTIMIGGIREWLEGNNPDGEKTEWLLFVTPRIVGSE